METADLTADHSWFIGPEFLYRPESDWPSLPALPLATEEEIAVWTGTMTKRKRGHKALDTIAQLIRRNSNLSKLKRIFSYVIRIVDVRVHHSPIRGSQPTAFEMANAFKFSVRSEQKSFYLQEISSLEDTGTVKSNSSLLRLKPFLGDDGILRVDGRISRGEFPEEFRQPMILPPDSALTRLLILHLHERLIHAGNERTIAEIRKNYFIPSIRRVVRRVLHSCPPCKRRVVKPDLPLMAALPAHRLLAYAPPFTHTGLYFFGHYFVTVDRRPAKRWVCLYTCMVTRAVHLELCESLNVDSFLNSFRRFVALRGKPAHCFSDNETNLTAGQTCLKNGIENWNQRKISDFESQRGIEWSFSPPSAPHFGGVWERLVQSAKRALSVVLGKRSVNEEMFRTIAIV